MTYMIIPCRPMTYDASGKLVEISDEQSEELMRATIKRIRRHNGTGNEPKWFSDIVPLEPTKINHSPDSPPRP